MEWKKITEKNIGKICEKCQMAIKIREIFIQVNKKVKFL